MAACTGFSRTPITCNVSNAVDSSGCADSGNDHSYRVYLRAGEHISIDLSTSAGCAGSLSWHATLVLYRSTLGCTDTTCPTRVLCTEDTQSTTPSYVAPADGWYFIVVDGNNDEGTYTLKVGLTCNAAGCEC